MLGRIPDAAAFLWAAPSDILSVLLPLTDVAFPLARSGGKRVMRASPGLVLSVEGILFSRCNQSRCCVVVLELGVVPFDGLSIVPLTYFVNRFLRKSLALLELHK